MAEGQPSSRREFLANSTTTAAIAGLAALGGCAAGQPGEGLRVVAGPRPKPVGKIINIGMIGAGGRGMGLLNTMLRQDDIEVAVKAVADPHPPHLERAVKAVADAGGKTPDAYDGPDDWRDKMLGRDDIHALLIAVPCYLHAKMYLGAFAAGKHYYGEKPMCLTVKEADALVAAQKRNPDVVAWIGFQRRGDQKYHDGIKHIHDGLLGDLIGGYGAWNISGGPLGLPSVHVWFGRRKLSGDWMLEQACHTWDIFNWVANGLPEAATGSGRTDLFKHLDPDRDVHDFYNAIVKYPDFLLDFEHSWVMPRTDREGVFNGVFERVMGQQGGIDLSGGRFFPREKGDILEFSHGVNADREAMLSFLRSIREGTPAVSGVENGRTATLTGLLVRKAVETGRWVTMKEILAEG